jgi:galactokinase
MPAAIDRDVLMACSASPNDNDASSSRITISNVNDAKFPAEEVTFQPGKDGPVLDAKAHSWVNYFKVSHPPM